MIHGDVRVRLTPLEFRLLACLAAHPNEIVSREELSRELTGVDEEKSNLVDVYVGYLRKKLGNPALITTKRGQGYALRTSQN